MNKSVACILSIVFLIFIFNTALADKSDFIPEEGATVTSFSDKNDKMNFRHVFTWLELGKSGTVAVNWTLTRQTTRGREHKWNLNEVILINVDIIGPISDDGNFAKIRIGKNSVVLNNHGYFHDSVYKTYFGIQLKQLIKCTGDKKVTISVGDVSFTLTDKQKVGISRFIDVAFPKEH